MQEIKASILFFCLWALPVFGVEGKDASTSNQDIDIHRTILQNPIAYITSQCFTKTVDMEKQVHNPCFTCHIKSIVPNYVGGEELQLTYNFPGLNDGEEIKNPWLNLFKDRTTAVAMISDQAMLKYLRQDNYLGNGRPILAQTLTQTLPVQWDENNNGRWDGYRPDAYFNFDEEGFDRDPQGGYTGWRAFAYAPFPGTFWPTNGSTDDVLIRLAPVFQQREDGTFDLTIYKTNLAILTAIIQERDVVLESQLDETVVQTDLNQDGSLAVAKMVRYNWAPLEGRVMNFVGAARQEQQAGRVHLAAGLFPEGTEFLHSVRYIDPMDDGSIRLAARMKELRYSVKRAWYNYSDLKEMALDEMRESVTHSDHTKQFMGNAELGLSNDQGWTYQGFIEDKKGNLRPQTYEETVFCLGCHSGLGATTDGTFAFARKFNETNFQKSWYHWTQKGLDGTPEPIRRDGEYEYSFYLQQNGAGDEFRINREVISKFFNTDGSLKADALEKLHQNITYLINPSRERALALNKAYKVIVEGQTFSLGRDATITSVENVHKTVLKGQSTHVRTPVIP